MADGFNLYFTEKDLHDLESSIDKGSVLNEGIFAANALDCLLKKDVDKFINILWDENNPKHQMMAKLAIKSMGNGKVSYSEEAKIPSALRSILEFTKDPTGLFSKTTNPQGSGFQQITAPV